MYISKQHQHNYCCSFWNVSMKYPHRASLDHLKWMHISLILLVSVLLLQYVFSPLQRFLSQCREFHTEFYRIFLHRFLRDEKNDYSIRDETPLYTAYSLQGLEYNDVKVLMYLYIWVLHQNQDVKVCFQENQNQIVHYAHTLSYCRIQHPPKTQGIRGRQLLHLEHFSPLR